MIRFRCPHCKQKTISLWGKAKANGWRPPACPGCGGKYEPSSWGIVPGMLVFFAVLLAPLFAGDGKSDLTWLLAGSFVLATVASLAAVLFATPLYRFHSRAARWDTWSFVGALVLLFAWAALTPRKDERPLALRLHQVFSQLGVLGERKVVETPAVPGPEDEERRRFREALAKGALPYTVEERDGADQLRWSTEHQDALAGLDKEQWGDPLPQGAGNAHFENPARAKEFRAWLKKNRVKHRTVTSVGKEFVVWEGNQGLVMKFLQQRDEACMKKEAAGKKC